HR
ncbi:catalase-peroxidase domain protein, partial [Vibrio parahaemolyticus 861]